MPASLQSYLKLTGHTVFEISEEYVFTNVFTANPNDLFLSENEFLGKSLREVLPPDLAHKGVAFFEHAKKTGERESFEYQSPATDDPRWFLGNVVFTHEEGKEPVFLFSTTDITEKKLAESSLKFHADFEEMLVHATSALIQSREENFDQSLNQVLERIGIFAGVDRTYFFRFNDDATVMSNTHEWCAEGISSEIENLQDVPSELVPNWMIKIRKHEEIYISALEELPVEWTIEKELLEPQGIKSLLVIPVAAEGSLYGFIGFDAVRKKILWDTNQRHLLQILADNLGSVMMRNKQNKVFQEATRQAKRLAEEATSANRYKSDFLANMSHEIRTPLNGVIGFTDLLLETSLTDLQFQYLQKVKYSAKSLLDVINQILDFSKIEAQKIELDIDRSDLIEIIERTCDLVRYAVGSKGFEFSVYIDPQIPRFYQLDSLRLQQILANLLSNAIKFTEEGFVELQVKMLSMDPQTNTADIYFAVTDTGIGITPEFQKRIFDAFAQADIRTNRKYGGTGLGVPIVNSLLQMMNSCLSINSEFGKGSTFSFTLKLSYEDGAAFESKPVVKGSRALLVNPSPRVQSVIEEFLHHNGFETVAVLQSQEALEALKSGEHFDALLVNHESGFVNQGLVRIIRRELNIGKDELPIILFYSSEEARLIERVKRYDVIKVSEKPISYTDLSNACNLVWQKSSGVEVAAKKVVKSKTQELDSRKSVVLIAEDNHTNMLFLKILVKQLYSKAVIIEARNGQQAVDLYKEHHPAIILMDIQMPEMDGDEATAIIRQAEIEQGTARTPIIALTANAMEGFREKCLSAGFDEYMSKPVNKEELTEVIARFVGGLPLVDS